ncbi:radical SAM protein [Paraburkholderia sp. SARCC-3016]|uniref:radical SAM/SPASM domain-containing protein n=1 Tax=Paraburkholderia sp. SARCC-3016 TaxID=3058611 RepID=UPI00280728F6|nr:radical SAM protein [Paraburkholderia sp. SARCC-3016]MDQ7982484.1 radical SAM protein [Paraburkholderia sp. SARCC-3016]
MNLPELAALKRRFAFRPELALLYDKVAGIELQLNESALRIVQGSFNAADWHQATSTLVREFAVPSEVLEADLLRCWTSILNAPSHAPNRKGGAPTPWLDASLPFPLVLEIELTSICNWHCDFCYNVWKVSDDYTPHLDERHLPLTVARSILDEAHANQCMRIRFSGGEPTLHPQFDEIVQYAGSLGFRIEVFTNGSRITPERALRFAQNGVRTMLVSMHGDEQQHNQFAAHKNAYSQAMRAMELALENGIAVVAETLVCAENIEGLERMVERLNSLGVRRIAFMPYVPFGPRDKRTPVAPREVERLIDRVKAVATPDTVFGVPCAPRHCLETVPSAINEPVSDSFTNHCAAGILWASVSFDGRLRHCPHSAVFAGNVEEGIGKLWREHIVPTVRASLAPDHDACGTCGQYHACRGGCHLQKVTNYHRPAHKRVPIHLVRGAA